MNFSPWLQGLIAAFISAAAGSFTAMGVAPDSFNLGAKWKNTLILAAVNGVTAAAAYLKQSPLPASSKPIEETNAKSE